MRLGLIVDGVCLEFRKKPKIKKGGTLMIQKGRLTDGRSLADGLGSCIQSLFARNHAQWRCAPWKLLWNTVKAEKG